MILCVFEDTLETKLLMVGPKFEIIAVIEAVFAAMFVVFSVMLKVAAFRLDVKLVILDVAAFTTVGKVEIVAELTPPILFTVGADAVPPKSFVNCSFPFMDAVASATVALVTKSATKAVVAI